MSVWYILFLVIGIMLVYIVGTIMSKEIENPVMYFLFWFMYLITIITFITVIMSTVFYLTIKDKEGPQGPRGDRGDNGDKGESGICEEGCRNRICTKKVMEAINEEINKVAGYPAPEIRVKNMYIKERVKQMCNSKEFKQLTPFRGPNDLIAYLKKIWTDWTGLIYRAGGRRYFESLGAENEFEWVKDNPFDEIKKYDVFYWGMGKTYRPEIIKKCEKAQGRTNNIQNSDDTGKQRGHPNIEKDDRSRQSVKVGKGWRKTGREQTNKSNKYSILSYLNLIPESEIRNQETNDKYKIKTTGHSEPNSYTVREYDPNTRTYDKCLRVDSANRYYTVGCNPSSKEQQWTIEYTGNNNKELKVKSKSSNQYLKPPTSINKSEERYQLFDLI